MKKIVLLLISAMMLAGCGSGGEKGVTVSSFEGIEITEIGNTGVNFDLNVGLNSTFRGKLKIEKAELMIVAGNRKIARVELVEKLVIMPRSFEKYNVRCRARIAQGTVANFVSVIRNLSELRIEGYVTGRKGMLKKRVRVEQVVTEAELRKIVRTLEKY